MKDKLLGILVGLLLGLGLLGSLLPGIIQNALHKERMRAMEGGAGHYYLNMREGKIDFQYVDLDEYTKYIIGQIQMNRAILVNPSKELQ